jgi:small-conductance mechanosensitive channel
MGWLITKDLVTAGIIVAVSEVAKRNDKLGALFVALPTVTILAIIWLYIEDQPNTKIASHMRYTFWYVLPSLPLFLIFPLLIDRVGFWMALFAGSIVSICCLYVLALILKRFDNYLLSFS